MNRRDLLAALQTLLTSVTGVTTVVRTHTAIDLTQYLSTQLPMVEIIEPAENTDQELTGRRQMVAFDLSLNVHFLVWGNSPVTAYETLVKNIRDKIGSDFCLGGKATGVWVTATRAPEGEYPLFKFVIDLTAKYYLDETST
jgi:hypothetical protein